MYHTYVCRHAYLIREPARRRKRLARQVGEFYFGRARLGPAIAAPAAQRAGLQVIVLLNIVYTCVCVCIDR